jgi:hypothetical protein
MTSSIFAQPFPSGDCIPIRLEFFAADNVTPMDLTGQYVGTTVKREQTDPDSSALYQHDIAGDSTGVINFMIPGFTGSAPTLIPGVYFIDFKRWDTVGCRYTAASGNLNIVVSTTARQNHT